MSGGFHPVHRVGLKSAFDGFRRDEYDEEYGKEYGDEFRDEFQLNLEVNLEMHFQRRVVDKKRED